jgi:hypothetical protein
MILERELQAEFGAITHPVVYSGGVLGMRAEAPLVFFNRLNVWLHKHFEKAEVLKKWHPSQGNMAPLRFEFKPLFDGLQEPHHLTVVRMPRQNIVTISFWPETGQLEI